MYFPYLRGKREEVRGLGDLGKAGALSELTLPIFDPIKLTPNFRNWYPRVIDKGLRFALIVNGADCEEQPAEKHVGDFLAELPEERTFPAFEIREDTAASDLARFVNGFGERTCIVIHRDHRLDSGHLESLNHLSQLPVQVIVNSAPPYVRDLPARGRVLIRDGFIRRKNSAYDDRDDFDDLLFAFEYAAYNGFGDFSIAGDEVTNEGRAQDVALHVTEILDRERRVVTNHFVSRTPSGAGPGRQHEQYASAISQLVSYVGDPPSPPCLDTLGVRKFLAKTEDFPGLPGAKRLGIIHHIEMMDRSIKARGFLAFV